MDDMAAEDPCSRRSNPRSRVPLDQALLEKLILLSQDFIAWAPFYDVTGPLWSSYFFEFPQKIIHFSALFGNPKRVKNAPGFLLFRVFKDHKISVLIFFWDPPNEKSSFFWFDKNPRGVSQTLITTIHARITGIHARITGIHARIGFPKITKKLHTDCFWNFHFFKFGVLPPSSHLFF